MQGREQHAGPLGGHRTPLEAPELFEMAKIVCTPLMAEMYLFQHSTG